MLARRNLIGKLKISLMKTISPQADASGDHSALTTPRALEAGEPGKQLPAEVSACNTFLNPKASWVLALVH